MDTLAKAIESIGVPTGIFNIENLVTALILLVVCLIVIKIIMRFVDRMLERSKVEKTMHSFIRSCVKYLLLFIAILIVASALGINITSLIALLGVLGLAVSLAVQGVLSNLAGGVMVLLSKPFKVGDYVLTGDTEGTVKEIGLTHTQIDTLDNKLVFVPNSELSAGKITNFSAEEKRMVELRFNASYDAPADEVYRALRDVMDSVPGFLQDPAPLINISAYGTSSIEYLFRGWVKNADYWPAYFQTLDEVKRMFDARGIKMTYDHINVHMMGGNDDE
jgi:small conductance mechanosensitive channel